MMEETATQEDLTTITTLQYASLWRRFGAGIIDCILLCGAIMVLYFLVGLISSISSADLSTQWAIVFYEAMIFLALTFLYFTVIESSTKQATVGKMVLGIIVTDHEGHRISFWRAVLRVILKVISAVPYGFLLLVSCFTIVFTRERKALHDMIAGTCVMMKS